MRFKSKLLFHQNTLSVWKKFKERYPHADLSRFTQKDWLGDTDAVYFKTKYGKEMIQVLINPCLINTTIPMRLKNVGSTCDYSKCYSPCSANQSFEFSSGVDLEFKT